jgi:hypothetical protein
MKSAVNTKPRKLRLVNSGSNGSKIARKVLEDEFGIDFDPIIELCRLAQRTDNDMVRANCLSQVCKFCYPQLKSVETKSTTTHEVSLSDGELVNRFRQYMESIDKDE